MIAPAFWRGRRVFVTGDTGFKGGWLCHWLARSGAIVAGYALPPETDPNLFESAGLATHIDHRDGDVRDAAGLARAVSDWSPSILLHLAAQALVRTSYEAPQETFETNVMGVVNAIEAARACTAVEAVVIVTSDKCYENREWIWGYREHEALGGHDPYSASKAAAEIVVGGYAQSYAGTRPRIASARAGNVIGGGDWNADRLIPDLVRAFGAGAPATIRRPGAIRPWQHALDALSGYLQLAERLAGADGDAYVGAWNFGPEAGDERTVGEVAAACASLWGGGAACAQAERMEGPHEAGFLKLDSAKARGRLGWTPRWRFDAALNQTIAWYRAFAAGEDMVAVMDAQIADHECGYDAAAPKTA